LSPNDESLSPRVNTVLRSSSTLVVETAISNQHATASERQRRKIRMNSATEAAAPVASGRSDASRRKATDLYRTTNLTVADISSRLDVSRATIYRWLRDEGIARGRNIKDGSVQVGEDLRRFGSDITELRREVTVLIGQVRRLEGLIEALVGLKTHAA
jgi:transposase-like protein